MNQRITKSYQFNYDLKQLRAFLEIAKEKSFSKAAENLFISQPAISRKISQLEEALKCQLFIRENNTVKLTPEGEELKNKLPIVFESLNGITESLTSLTKKKKLKLGYTCAAMSSFLPEMIREITDKLENYELIFSEGNTTELIDKVLNNNIHCAFIMAQPKHESLLTISIRPELMGLMIPDNHPFNSLNEIPIELLQYETLILFPKPQNPSLYDHILECCMAAQFSPNAIIEADSCNAIFGFVAAGTGVAFIAESMAGLCMKGTRYKPLVQPGPEIEFSFISNNLSMEDWHMVFENLISDNYFQNTFNNNYSEKSLSAQNSI